MQCNAMQCNPARQVCLNAYREWADTALFGFHAQMRIDSSEKQLFFEH